MTGGKRSSKRSGRTRNMWSLQRVRPYCARRSACKVVKSSPGQTMIASASIVPRLVSSFGGDAAWTAVSRRKVTWKRSPSQAASWGIASRDSTRASCGL